MEPQATTSTISSSPISSIVYRTIPPSVCLARFLQLEEHCWHSGWCLTRPHHRRLERTAPRADRNPNCARYWAQSFLCKKSSEKGHRFDCRCQQTIAGRGNITVPLRGENGDLYCFKLDLSSYGNAGTVEPALKTHRVFFLGVSLTRGSVLRIPGPLTHRPRGQWRCNICQNTRI